MSKIFMPVVKAPPKFEEILIIWGKDKELYSSLPNDTNSISLFISS